LRQDCSTSLSKTSASDAQNTRGRARYARLYDSTAEDRSTSSFAAAERRHPNLGPSPGARCRAPHNNGRMPAKPVCSRSTD
jgi:hypothetical protein